MPGIGEQLEAEPFLGAKLLVGVFVLHAHADDRCVLLFILSEVALEIVRFDGAPAGEILRVEIEHHPFALEVVQADRFAFLRIQREIRSCRAYRGRFVAGT